MPGHSAGRFKLWLAWPDVEGNFGDGKWRLLRAIDQTGSLKAAAASLGISYRKAWGDLKKAEACLKVSLMDRQRGGHLHGQTRLTVVGKTWVRAYARFRADVEQAAQRGYDKHIRSLSEGRNDHT